METGNQLPTPNSLQTPPEPPVEASPLANPHILPEEKPIAKKVPLIKILLALVTLFIIFVVALLIIKTKAASSPAPAPTATPSETQPSWEGLISDWITYTNKELGFSVRFPNDWQTQVNAEEAGTVWLKAPDDSKIQILAAEGTETGFTFIPFPAPSEELTSSLSQKNYDLIMATFKKMSPTDYSGWKVWTDPNEFTLRYPPNAKVRHLNESTTIEVKSDRGTSILTLCRNCFKEACIGTCDQKKDIKIPVGGLKYAESQISPNEEGNFTFRVVLAYPNTYLRKKLVIFGNYPYEEALEEIGSILSTLQFTE